MGGWQRAFVLIVAAALAAGCGTTVTPTAVPTATPAGSTAPTTTPAMPTPTPAISAPPSATPAPPATPTPSPAPVGAGGFRTPAPPPAGATWTGIRWRKIAAGNPLSHVRSITRWDGGFVAVGDIAVTDGMAGTRAWSSSDGRTWDLLAPSVFGPSAFVIGVAPLGDGVVAFTMEAGEWSDNGSRTDPSEWSLVGPWRSWTSTDGRSWTAHPGPGFRIPVVDGYGDDQLGLLAGVGHAVVALVLDGQPLAFTRDGATWEPARLASFPGGPAGWQPGVVTAAGPGFLAVGSAAATSADGRTWTEVTSPSCPVQDVYAGSTGLIVTGEEGDPHVPAAVWCQTKNGRAWRDVANLAPLGRTTAGDCRGTCANGILDADGERILAYRNHAGQAGWTSRDGRTWTRLTFSGPRPAPWRDLWGSYEMIVTPIGILLYGGPKGSAWLGVPQT